MSETLNLSEGLSALIKHEMTPEQEEEFLSFLREVRRAQIIIGTNCERSDDLPLQLGLYTPLDFV